MILVFLFRHSVKRAAGVTTRHSGSVPEYVTATLRLRTQDSLRISQFTITQTWSAHLQTTEKMLHEHEST